MLKAEIQIGRVKKTPNQHKKHFSQFTKRENRILRERVSKIKMEKVWSSFHLRGKDAITYDMDDIKRVFRNHNIIEYNVTYKPSGKVDKRVVLRGRDKVMTDKGEMNVCVVVSLINNAMVTVYYNSANIDTHTRLNMDRYSKNLEIKL